MGAGLILLLAEEGKGVEVEDRVDVCREARAAVRGRLCDACYERTGEPNVQAALEQLENRRQPHVHQIHELGRFVVQRSFGHKFAIVALRSVKIGVYPLLLKKVCQRSYCIRDRVWFELDFKKSEIPYACWSNATIM